MVKKNWIIEKHSVTDDWYAHWIIIQNKKVKYDIAIPVGPNHSPKEFNQALRLAKKVARLLNQEILDTRNKLRQV